MKGLETMENEDFDYAQAAEELIIDLFDEWQSDIGAEFPEREQWEQSEKKAVEMFCKQKGVEPQSEIAMMFWAFRAGVNKGVKITQIIGAIYEPTDFNEDNTEKGDRKE